MDSGITIISNEPNNGYIALVFTDKGVNMSSDCSLKDAYNGLIQVAADVIIDVASGITPPPSVKAKDEEEYDKKATAHIKELDKILEKFTRELKERIMIESAASQFKSTGMNDTFAHMLAEGMHKLPGVFEVVDDLLKEDKKDSKDSE
jgi:hypothetical protein